MPPPLPGPYLRSPGGGAPLESVLSLKTYLIEAPWRQKKVSLSLKRMKSVFKSLEILLLNDVLVHKKNLGSTVVKSTLMT